MAFRVRGQRDNASLRSGTRGLAFACAFLTFVSACSGQAADTTTTSTTAPSTTTTTLPPDPAVDGPVYRVGLTSSPTTANWWAVMDDQDGSANRAILTNTKEALFGLTEPGFAHVPSLAATEQPEQPRQQGSIWVVEQAIKDGVFWSDGEQVTADDLVFYFDVVRELALGGRHASNFPASVTDVSAVDDLTVRVEFGSEPALTDWETGVAMAPLVPAHHWEPFVEEARQAAESERESITDAGARAAVAAASLADTDPDNDLTPDQVSNDQVASHRANAAAEAGRDHLYAVESLPEPSSGSLVLESRDGDVAFSRSNPDFFGRGAETTVYAGGSVRLATPGSDSVYGGDAAGDIVAHHVVGPFVSGVQWRAYESEELAHEARAAGEVDFVIDPDGLTYAQYNEVARAGDTELATSQADGFRFLAFNLRKPPMSDPVFREAVATVIDKELVAASLFNGTLFPAYTVVHPELALFHNPDVDRPGWANGAPMGGGERYETAIGLLGEAGYTWDTPPELVYDADGDLSDVVPGIGLEMPNGVDVPDLEIMAAPGSGEDPVRATYALWIAQWISDLGIPVTTEPTDLDSIVETSVRPASSEDILSWDMQILGWGGPNLALPGLTLVALFHSRNGVESGGLNTTGYSSPEFDAAADAMVASRSIEEAARWTREMERIISEDLPYVTLYRPSVIEAVGSGVTLPVDTIMGGHGAVPGAWPESVRVDR